MYGYNPSPPKLEGIRRPTSKTALLQSKRLSLAPQPATDVHSGAGGPFAQDVLTLSSSTDSEGENGPAAAGQAPGTANSNCRRQEQDLRASQQQQHNPGVPN
ncbi:histone-lysine N-methyltransferase SETDB1-like [Strigops habroptila]|uniref:histone-lysine N-methyltransferase SETDB1-like n=1 Tax=Strigops habroptila TaxID=2489341 RepID=UPI0011CF958D|nr:histone-lysine N-methyltransferase SETDB1-like [Strigops habroptila]